MLPIVLAIPLAVAAATPDQTAAVRRWWEDYSKLEHLTGNGIGWRDALIVELKWRDVTNDDALAFVRGLRFPGDSLATVLRQLTVEMPLPLRPSAVQASAYLRLAAAQTESTLARAESYLAAGDPLDLELAKTYISQGTGFLMKSHAWADSLSGREGGR
jgi:hypothetical protein